ncbi:MAG: hypothetical protein ABI886_07330 [Betaproteobacteria bacterium]
MSMNTRWALPLALIGGVAVGAAFTLRRRTERRHVAKRQLKEGLQNWEDEGGSLATPATVQHPS